MILLKKDIVLTVEHLLIKNTSLKLIHLVKNFNDNVISKIRKDEYKRLCTEGKYKQAASLKGPKYILMFNRSTLQRKDVDAKSNKVQYQGS